MSVYILARFKEQTMTMTHRPPYESCACHLQKLSTANRHLFAVLRFQLNTYSSVAGPMAWNSLPDYSRILSGIQRAAQTVLGFT